MRQTTKATGVEFRLTWPGVLIRTHKNTKFMGGFENSWENIARNVLFTTSLSCVVRNRTLNTARQIKIRSSKGCNSLNSFQKAHQ